jgi:hypothetical protein
VIPMSVLDTDNARWYIMCVDISIGGAGDDQVIPDHAAEDCASAYLFVLVGCVS